MHPTACPYSRSRPITPIGNSLIEDASNARRSAQGRDERGGANPASRPATCHMGGGYWHKPTSAGPRASPALSYSPKITQPSVASENNSGRLGNYADPAAETGVSRSRSSRRRFRQQQWSLQISPVRHWKAPSTQLRSSATRHA